MSGRELRVESDPTPSVENYRVSEPDQDASLRWREGTHQDGCVVVDRRHNANSQSFSTARQR